jgi:hypothetical protein
LLFEEGLQFLCGSFVGFSERLICHTPILSEDLSKCQYLN